MLFIRKGWKRTVKATFGCRPLADFRHFCDPQQMQSLFALITLLAASTVPAPPVQISDRTDILRTVLTDARAKWRETSTPCLSSLLKTFGSPQDAAIHVSDLLGENLPFAICQKSTTQKYFTVSTAMVQGRTALVEFDYNCSLCGYGTTYTLRKTGNGWNVVDRERSWTS